MNLLFFLTPKQDVLFVYEDFTLRQALEKWSNQRFATIPVLRRNGGTLKIESTPGVGSVFSMHFPEERTFSPLRN